MNFKRANVERALSWMNWLYGCLFGAACLGYGIAFAGHGLSLWEMPHLNAFFTAFSFGSAGCANLVSGLQKLGGPAAQAGDTFSAARVEPAGDGKSPLIART